MCLVKNIHLNQLKQQSARGHENIATMSQVVTKVTSYQISSDCLVFV